MSRACCRSFRIYQLEKCRFKSGVLDTLCGRVFRLASIHLESGINYGQMSKLRTPPNTMQCSNAFKARKVPVQPMICDNVQR